jgi:hypothetical protein
MSDTHLPDDLTSWPTEPTAILGVSRDIDPRELRRAYTRLIRVYKPEHFPEEFRRIRDAYEMLRNYAEYRHGIGNAMPLDAAAPADDGEERSPNDADTRDILPEPSRMAASVSRPAPAVDRLVALWERAERGELAEAYAGYCQLQREQPHNADVYLRLYWLLALQPALDSRRGRCDWLAQGLHRFGPRGPLLEAYHRELENDPHEAIGPRCEALLHQVVATVRLAELAARRWNGATAIGHWPVVAADLTRLRPRVEPTDHAVWVRLLLHAAATLSWNPKWRDLAMACRHEVESYSDEHVALAAELDRAELHAEVVAGWHKLRGAVFTISWAAPPANGADSKQPAMHLSQALYPVLRGAGERPFYAVLPHLLQFLRPLVERPAEALGHLDRVNHFSAAVMGCLQQQVEMLYWRQCDRTAPDAARLASDVRQFLASRDWGRYEKFRPEILTYCIRQQIRLDDFRQAILAVMSERQLQASGIGERLRCDLALHCLCTACRAFWS